MPTVRWAEVAPEVLRSGVVIDLRERPSAVLVLDDQGRIVGANRAAEGLFGTDVQSWLGRSREGAGLRLISPDGAILTADQDPLARALAGSSSGAPHIVGWEGPGPSGSPRLSWLEVMATAVRDADGNVVGLTSTWSDVTTSEAGRAATTQLARSARLLRRERDLDRVRFSAVADNTTEVVLQSDIGGQVVWASPSLSDVLGWDAAEVVGHSLLPLVHPDDRERVNEARRTAVQSGDDSATVTELRYATRDGGWRWMRVHTRRLHDDGGLALGAISAAQDISREIELRERHRSLERYDDLTGLINRDAAVHHRARVLDATKGTGRCAGVLYLDIDDFKRVNDDHGLAVGDELLVAVASHLTSTLRESDVVARMGADEFLVILASVREDWHAITRAQTLRESLADLTVEGLPAFTVSIGVVTDDGDGSAPADIEAAKRAVRRAKLEGRDRIAF